MIHWRIENSATCRLIILLAAILFLTGIVFTNHDYLVKTGLSVCTFFLYHRLITYRKSLPLALTYQSSQWSFINSNKINNYRVSSGFAIWPICIIEYFDENEPDLKLRLTLSYWDVVPTEYGGNWNQLGVVLNLSKRQNTQRRDILSLIS